MDEIAIKKHNFDFAINRLKEFSEKTDAELEIDKVRTDGGFLGLGDHKVTGDELNERLGTIQEHFIAVNETSDKLMKEFREVYCALDVLDKDYITSIISNVKEIEKTSNDIRVQQRTLKQHNEKLADQQNKLDLHQAEIEKTVANISKLIIALKGFKEKLEGYQHLADIDKIWKDVDEYASKIIECERRYENLTVTIQKNKEELNKNIAEAVQKSNVAIESLSKKVRYAYWIAGGSVGVVIIELVLLLMRVI